MKATEWEEKVTVEVGWEEEALVEGKEGEEEAKGEGEEVEWEDKAVEVVVEWEEKEVVEATWRWRRWGLVWENQEII